VGTEDKAKQQRKSATGKAKEATGKATGNESLETEGKRDQSKADMKKAGQNVKDAFKR